MTSVEKRSRSEWAALFLAAAELVRQGCLVSFTMGNRTPVADLLVAHVATGSQFMVDVKGQSSRNQWIIGIKEDVPMLFYILVLVGSARDKDCFFVLRQAEAKRLIQENAEAHPHQKPLNPKGFSGFSFSAAVPFKDQWDNLPHLSSN
jgi:hypothetical protein